MIFSHADGGCQVILQQPHWKRHFVLQQLVAHTKYKNLHYCDSLIQLGALLKNMSLCLALKTCHNLYHAAETLSWLILALLSSTMLFFAHELVKSSGTQRCHIDCWSDGHQHASYTHRWLKLQSLL